MTYETGKESEGLYSVYDEYLASLERQAGDGDFDRYYLWPRTPIEGIQSRILKRVGATDYQAGLWHSRPFMIIKEIETLIKDNLVNYNFSVLDIACGDAIVLGQIKKAFPKAYCAGVDCNKGKFEAHAIAEREGIRLFKVYIQHLFRKDTEKPFDIVLMLNTYRGWESANLSKEDRELPSLADKWFGKNGRFVILTATERQIKRLRIDFSVHIMGKGEDDSLMICIAKEKLPFSV